MLDLIKDYHQLQLDKESHKTIAFTSLKGLFQWKVLLHRDEDFWAVFQQLMDDLLEDLQPKFIGFYINAITIYSPSWKQYIKDLNAVLSKFSNTNLKINIEKCTFMKLKVVVLGNLLNAAGIHLNLVKLQAI